MSVQTYSPSKVVLTFGGYVASGWDTISIKRESPSFKVVRGIRGKNSRVRTNNTAASVTISVPQTSMLNAVLHQVVKKDEEFGTGKLEIMIKDTMGTEIFRSGEGFVEAPADTTYDTEITNREWTIHCLSSNYDNGEGWGVMSLINSIF